MRPRAIATTAWVILLAVFAADVLTPQTLVIAILLDVPIVLAALTRSRRLTATLVATAVACDVVAAFANAAHDGYRWDAIGVADRILSIFSISLVGFLSTAVQERSERVGRLAAQESRAQREVMLAQAADRLRASLSRDLVARAVTREALWLFAATGAAWYPDDGDGTPLIAHAGEDEVVVPDERIAPEIASLVRRTLDGEAPLTIRGDEPVGRLVLDRLPALCALAIPVSDRGRAFGVLLLWRDQLEILDEGGESVARSYARLAVGALAQARLFAQLAERNEALAERGAVIRDLVYALSHDLRTPLAALTMTLRQARDGAYGALPDAYHPILDNSAVAVDDLQRLAETLLLVARFEADERHPEPRSIDVVRLTEQIVAEFGAIARTRLVALRLRTDRKATVRADRGEVRRAIANLVANALQHTPERGNVEIDIRVTADRHVEIAVADDGYGVDPTVRSALFERFANGATRAGGGTGLGLYIVRRIIEASGGDVRYEPQTTRGSRFVVTLPEDPE